MVKPGDTEPLQECIDHKLWDDNLRAAFWVLTLVGIFSPLFTKNLLISIVFILAAVVLLVVAAVLDVKHIKWHFDKDGKNK